MENFQILIKDELLPSFKAEYDYISDLNKDFKVHELYKQPDAKVFLNERGNDINAIITTYAKPEKITAQFLSQFPNLQMIAHFGVGYNTLDIDYAKKNNIIITNTPDVLTEEVADLSMGLILATVRRIPQADKYLKDGRWQGDGNFPLSASLRGRKIGVVGLGRIGKAIAKRLSGFDIDSIVYHGRNQQQNIPYKYFDDLKEMAQYVDMLVIAAPGGQQTNNIINAEILNALGKDGILINIARGSLVDQDALIEALKSGVIHSAGLDVYAAEPQVPAQLIQLDNVVTLPHVASATYKTRSQMGKLVVDNIRLFSAGKSPLTTVPETPFTGKRVVI